MSAMVAILGRVMLNKFTQLSLTFSVTIRSFSEAPDSWLVDFRSTLLVYKINAVFKSKQGNIFTNKHFYYELQIEPTYIISVCI